MEAFAKTAKLCKDAGVDGALELNPQELAQINAWSRRELKAEEVYAFAVKLCDNEVDRDREYRRLKGQTEDYDRVLREEAQE